MKKCLIYSCLAIFIFLLLFLVTLVFRATNADVINLGTYQKNQNAEQYVTLPIVGENYQTNSYITYAIGRHYIKGKIAATILSAYEQLAQTQPELSFIYAEMGWSNGGQFKPHRTHRNGLSADFITPVFTVNQHHQKTPTTLPTHIFNLWGYLIRLDQQGKTRSHYEINTKALIAHIAALDHAGKNFGVRIKRIILDPPILDILRKNPEFRKIQHLHFMQGQAWFPHDGHYHIDFY